MSSTANSRSNNTTSKRVWLVRAGRMGQDESTVIEQNIAILGFQDIPNLSQIKSFEKMVEHARMATPGASEPNIRNRASQLNAFSLRMKVGDIVALPLKTRPGTVALGRVMGQYKYRDMGESKRHTRDVEWIRPDTPRSDFGQDLLNSLGAFMTVCRIQRNNAGDRIAAILNGCTDPAAGTTGSGRAATIDEEGPSDEDVPINIAQVAQEQIQTHIQARFAGHNLARLVDAVLQAEGYVTRFSPPGPDGGVDILAGMGSLGLDNPRLCVQVKATIRPVDVNVLRALQGTMQTFSANQGLLVSWGGFTGPMEREARQSFFTVRLWNAGDFLKALYRSYERLPEEIQADLPLKRVWTLVLEEGEE